MRIFYTSLFLLVASCCSAAMVADPIGDHFGSGLFQPDLTSVDAQVSDDEVAILLQFTSTISPASDFAMTNNLVGFVDIDLDQDAATGAQSQQSIFGNLQNSGLGAELHIDLFSEQFHPGTAEIVDSMTATTVGEATLEFESNSLNITFPRTVLRDTSGEFAYGVVVGDLTDHSDEAGPAVATVVPEPSTLLPMFAPAIILLLRRRSVSS